MLGSQTDIRRNRFVGISMVAILIIGSLLILGVQTIPVHEFLWPFIIFFIIGFFVGTDRTVDVMQSAMFELNISDSLNCAQTNTAIANEAKEDIEIREW